MSESGRAGGEVSPEQLLLRTKLAIPQRRACLVERPRLAAKLRPAPANSVVLVTAPAGFGKTTLLSWWAEQRAGQLAWLSLDEADNEPHRFWRYTFAALRSAGAPLSPELEAALQKTTQDTWETLVGLLINAISRAGSTITLVLDDYHLIHANTVHLSLGYLLRRQPEQLQVVILTRADPPLALARLRVEGHLSEIRAADLRFTANETEAFLRCSLPLPPSREAVSALAERIEGWPAGWQLAALSLQGLSPEETMAFATHFSGADNFVLSYLIEEVLARQPRRVQTFMLHTSVLRTLTGPLCTAVTGFDDAGHILERLAGENLFVFPLEGMPGWYRYHRLFAGMLRSHLQQTEPDLVPELRRRATAWFARQDIRQGVAGHLLPEPLAPRPLAQQTNAALLEPLTTREREILSLIAQGFSNQQIAEQLVISVGTVKGHVNHILSKLDVQSRTAAVARARELGLLPR